MKRAGETFSNSILRHEECISAHYQPVMGALKYGEYIADIPFSGYSSYQLSAGSFFAGIFVAASDMTVNSLAVYISTPSPEGKQLRLGIYSCGDEMYPGSLLLDAGTISASKEGRKELAINQFLARGYYYLVVLAEEICSLRLLKLSQSPLGMYSTFNAVYTGFGCSSDWGALPEVFPDGAMSSNVMRMVIARIVKRV